MFATSLFSVWMMSAQAATLSGPVHIIPREPLTYRVVGASSGAMVAFVRSDDGLGAGRCAPIGSTNCLDIVGPYTTIWPVRADAQGVAEVTFQANGSPRPIHVQALILTPTPSTTNVLEVSLTSRTGDLDGDGATNAQEFFYGTPLDDEDADNDGILDGMDLWPFDPTPPDPWSSDDIVVSDPTRSMPDPEFDGDSARVTWQDRAGLEVWVADLEPTTGAIVPPNGRGTLVDTNVSPISTAKNGPEWLFTSTGNQIVYGVSVGGVDHVARAIEGPTGWVREVIAPGLAPFGSMEPGDPNPRLYYYEATPQGDEAHTRFLDDPSSDLNWGAALSYGRFRDGDDELQSILQVQGTWQVMLADPTTGVLEQLTHTTTFKRSTFAWRAPELNGDEVFFTTGGPRRGTSSLGMHVYHKVAGTWTLHSEIRPPPAFPYVISPEPMVVNGRSYIAFLASTKPLNSDAGPAEVWIADIDPNARFARRVSDPSMSGRSLKDPEPLVLGGQGYVYYSEIAPNGDRIIHRCATGL